jgi:hypothetical protein
VAVAALETQLSVLAVLVAVVQVEQAFHPQ